MTNLSNAQQPAYSHSSHPTAMAPKAHSAHRAGGGLVRTHSRTSSGGGSRLGLNTLQLTQKEPAPGRHLDKSKKAYLHHEVNKSSTHLARNNSSVRLHSRDPANPAALRRASTPLGSTNGTTSKQRVGFTIASPSEGDDDEWVSSESGAATPSHESDNEEAAATPVDKRMLHLPPPTIQTNGFAKDDYPTPRAEVPPLPRVETARPIQSSLAESLSAARRSTAQLQPPQPAQQSGVSQAAIVPTELQQQAKAQPEPLPISQSPHVTKARSETHSPPRRSPDVIKRQAMTRPPSTNSITSTSTHALRPHPLIRALSAGHGAFLRPAKPVPLAPLTTVPTESIPAEMSSASPTSLHTASPTLSMQTNSVSPVLSQPSPSGSEASRQLRRTSTSSRSSVATLPVPSMHSSMTHSQLGRTSNHDRQRTLSTSSTFGGALSNLSNINMQMRSAPSPPKTPVHHVTVYFPPNEHVAQSESMHTLLPPPYLSAHLTMLAYRNPLAESYDRVMRAKQGR